MITMADVETGRLREAIIRVMQKERPDIKRQVEEKIVDMALLPVTSQERLDCLLSVMEDEGLADDIKQEVERLRGNENWL